MNCIIVDDNRIDRLIVENYLQPFRDFTIAGSFSNAPASMETIRRSQVEVMFMDIDMPEINGLDFLKTLPAPPVCVFITGYSDYALDAFDVHAFEFLLKPIKKDRFAESMRRLRDYFAIRQKALQYELHFENGKICIKEGTSFNNIQSSEIIYLEALTNYTRVVTSTRKFTTLCNLKHFLDRLPPDKFIRIHRSYAVAVNKIQRVEPGFLKIDSVRLPIGKTYRHQINKALAISSN